MAEPHIAIRGHINSRYEMLRASYEFKGSAKCKACHAAIEWWKTTRGKLIPYDPIADDEAQTVAHWVTCPGADSFRNPKGAAPTEPGYTPVTRSAGDKTAQMQRDIETLCAKHNLRAVILLHDGGRVFSYRVGIPGEDLRCEICNKLYVVGKHSDFALCEDCAVALAQLEEEEAV